MHRKPGQHVPRPPNIGDVQGANSIPQLAACAGIGATMLVTNAAAPNPSRAPISRRLSGGRSCQAEPRWLPSATGLSLVDAAPARRRVLVLAERGGDPRRRNCLAVYHSRQTLACKLVQATRWHGGCGPSETSVSAVDLTHDQPLGFAFGVRFVVMTNSPDRRASRLTVRLVSCQGASPGGSASSPHPTIAIHPCDRRRESVPGLPGSEIATSCYRSPLAGFGTLSHL